MANSAKTKTEIYYSFNWSIHASIFCHLSLDDDIFLMNNCKPYCPYWLSVTLQDYIAFWAVFKKNLKFNLVSIVDVTQYMCWNLFYNFLLHISHTSEQA